MTVSGEADVFDWPVAGTVDAIIAAHARSSPEASVIVAGDAYLTRAGLERRAGQVADQLRREGGRPGETVAVCLPRSIDQVVASLGVMKAGATCLALSPFASTELLRFRLADSGVARIIVDRLDDPVVGAAGGATPMILSAHADGAQTFGATPPSGDDGARIACVIPVDGPGGATCGAEITHGNLVFLAEWLRRGFRVDTRDRVCHMAQPGTPAAMLELWPALASGATVVIVDDPVAADPVLMRDWFRRQAISVILVAEDAMDALALPGWTDEDALRLVMAESDSATPIPGRKGFRLVATYGHGECSSITTARDVAANDRAGGRNIGQPISGASLYILDDAGERVTSGEEGNVWIGGRGVGRGYRNRPDLTADRFVPDPFGADPGGMIFDTGRRARVVAGGGIASCDRASAGAR